ICGSPRQVRFISLLSLALTVSCFLRFVFFTSFVKRLRRAVAVSRSISLRANISETSLVPSEMLARRGSPQNSQSFGNPGEWFPLELAGLAFLCVKRGEILSLTFDPRIR